MKTKHRGFRIIRLVLMILVIWTTTGAVISEGKEKYFPLDKIKPGLSGYGYTVFGGVKIEKFDVKVLAVTKNEKQPGALILVRLSGGALEKNGGLSAGMSGSPVYISGKLAGAISYGFENADPFLAMITPIDEMLNLMRDDATGTNPGLASLGTPVLVSGMGRRGYQLVRDSLERYGLRAISTPGMSGYPNINPGKLTLQPGSAIGAQMIVGDYQMAAIGTVTMADDRSFLAFGHPFTNRGTVDYVAVAAYIFQTVKSPVMSYKLGAPIKPVGRIIQDRQTGIYGRLGESPALIGVTVNVQDQERSLARQSSFQVITDEQLYRDLVLAGVTDAIDQTISRLGSGTATVSLRITFETPAGAIETLPALSRENLFFGKDIAAECLEDLRTALDILTLNEYTAVTVRSIELDIKVQPRQITARILKLTGAPARVKPGETVKFSVTAHSYRGDDFTVPFEVTLPADLEPGKLVFTARGGSRGGTGEEENDRQKKSSTAPDGNSQSKNTLNALLDDFMNAPKNNELVLEYQPFTGNRSPEENGADRKENEPAKPKPIQQKAAAGYYIQGEAQLTLEVIQG